MDRSKSYKKANYPNVMRHKTQSYKSIRRAYPHFDKFVADSDKRDFYYKKLTWKLNPKEFLKQYRLYEKYCKKTKCKIDPKMKLIAENSERVIKILKRRK